MEEENQKAIDNALFKKLEEISMKMNADPILYKTDVDNYLQMFRVELDKVQGDTMKKNQRFGELLIFLARTVKHFPETLGWIPGAVMKLMEELGPTLHPYIRKKCVGSIMILRAKSILLPVSTIEFLLTQMRLEDKELRSIIYKYVLNDIRRMNSHHQNNKINQQIRAFISSYIPKHNDKTSQKSLKMMIELYKRNVWTDTRSVNIIAEACFSPSSRIRLMACHFLMETTMPLQELPDSDDEPVKPEDLKPKKGIVRQTKAKEKQLQKEKKKAARRLRKKEIQSRNSNFMPIDLIYNPQVFAEKLFNIMSVKNQKYNHKLMYMSLIGRVIWRHKLILLPFYRSLIKYLEPKQKDVSQVLTALAESIHDIVPEDQIQAIIKHIIQHFVNDRCSQFTMTIGLNTLRQIFKKLPSIITEEMMLYLCTYYEYKNKNVSKAAKSVINLVREYNNMLLPKKFRANERNRGDDQDENLNKDGPTDRIPGAELLPNQGNLPIEMDRILTDEDFKKMRKMMKKKEEEKSIGNIVDNQIQYSDDDQEEEASQGEENELEDEELEIEVEDQNQESQDEEIEDEDQEQQSSEEQEEEEEEEESVIDWGDAQEIELQDDEDEEEEEEEEEEEQPQRKTKKSKKIVKQPKENKKKKQNLQKVHEENISEDEDSEEYQDQEEQDDAHGFIYPNQIAYYKMSKGQLKAQKKNVKESKEKFKHKPKDKKGGSNNREKQRLKPIMMVRAKKNKIRSNEKQLKWKIKNLKNQLGKVRSGKQAKKQKNKIIHKN